MSSPLDAFRVPLDGRSVWRFFGGVTLLCLILLAATGILLSMYYVPSALSADASGPMDTATTAVASGSDTAAGGSMHGAGIDGADARRSNVAFESVQRISTSVPFGAEIRTLHLASAYTLFCSLLIHLFSTVFLLAWRGNRAGSWNTGMALLLLVFAAGFTGYVLPWDRTAYFSVSISLGYLEHYVPLIGPVLARILRGGTAIDAGTLTRMASLHTTILPMAMLGLVWWHLVQVRTAGLNSGAVRDVSLWILLASLLLAWVPYLAIGSALLAIVVAVDRISDAVAPPAYRRRPAAETPASAPYATHYIFRDLLAWLLIVGGLITAVVVLIGGDTTGESFPARASSVPADVTAPMTSPDRLFPEWYFLFAYQLLSHVSGHIAVALMLGSVAVLWLLPVFDRPPYSPSRGRAVRVVGVVLLTGFLALTAWGYLATT